MAKLVFIKSYLRCFNGDYLDDIATFMTVMMMMILDRQIILNLVAKSYLRYM